MRVLRRWAGTGMKTHRSMVRLLLLGAGPRLAGAALIAALLWAGFVWATSTPGSL